LLAVGSKAVVARRVRARASWRSALLCGSAVLGVTLLNSRPASAQIPIYGVTGAHDPSTLLQYGDEYLYFCTGQGILSRVSYDMEHWINGPAVFSTQPAWTTTAVPGFTGFFWAPDVAYFDGLYHLYYAVSTFGSQVSAIGTATNTTLNTLDYANYKWVDQGPVIQSTNGLPYNAIDPSILLDPSGSIYMSFGSYFSGIFVTKIDPSTGKPFNNANTLVARSSSVPGQSAIEASYLYHQGNYYYLFVNYGTCCQGVNSTYNIRMGRGTSPTGPFYDETDVNMTNAGGTLLLGSTGNYIGPGQIGIMPQNNVDWMSYHYYDGNNNGTPTYALRQLYWTHQGWPTVTAPPSESITWNNIAGPGDGMNWDVARNLNFQDTSGVSNYLEGDSVTFNDNNNGHYAVTLNSTVNPASLTFNNSAGNYTVSGTGGIAGLAALTKTGSSAVTLSTVNTYTGGTNVNAGVLAIGAPGGLPNGSVNVAGGTLSLATGIGATTINSLNISSPGRFDVNNNKLLITYTGASPVATIQSYLASGYSNGNWDGNGLDSTAASANYSYALGYADGADGVVAGLSSGQIEVVYTLYGDANLDGVVNGTDFAILASNFGQAEVGWDKGDFNYDGVVNGTDFALLAANFGQTAAGVAVILPASDWAALDSFASAHGLLADLPEPSAATFAMTATSALLRRRRSR
jgi:autotransporter-associated beta strand protein